MSEAIVEAVGAIVIAEALKLVAPKANEFKPIRYCHVVMDGMDKDHLEEYGSMEEYCEACIAGAVARRRAKYFDTRREMMGKIYELSKYGYVTHVEFIEKEDDDKNIITGSKLTKTRAPKEWSKEKAIKSLEKRLSKEYSPRRIFSSEEHDTYGCETDNFKHCDSCGKMFGYYPSITDQELDHWEEMSESDLKEAINDPESAYILQHIFDSDIDEERIWKLASRLTS